MKVSFSFLARLSAVLILVACAQCVYANTFDFSFSGTGISGSGTLTATFVSGDEFLVTSIDGTQNGMAMTLLVPMTYADNDNDVFSLAPFLDIHGLGFSVGSVDYNIYYDAALSSYFECSKASTPCTADGDGTPVTFGALAATPEPSSLLLLGTGLLGLGPFVRRFGRA